MSKLLYRLTDTRRYPTARGADPMYGLSLESAAVDNPLSVLEEGSDPIGDQLQAHEEMDAACALESDGFEQFHRHLDWVRKNSAVNPVALKMAQEDSSFGGAIIWLVKTVVEAIISVIRAAIDLILSFFRVAKDKVRRLKAAAELLRKEIQTRKKSGKYPDERDRIEVAAELAHDAGDDANLVEVYRDHSREFHPLMEKLFSANIASGFAESVRSIEKEERAESMSTQSLIQEALKGIVPKLEGAAMKTDAATGDTLYDTDLTFGAQSVQLRISANPKPEDIPFRLTVERDDKRKAVPYFISCPDWAEMDRLISEVVFQLDWMDSAKGMRMVEKELKNLEDNMKNLVKEISKRRDAGLLERLRLGRSCKTIAQYFSEPFVQLQSYELKVTSAMLVVIKNGIEKVPV